MPLFATFFAYKVFPTSVLFVSCFLALLTPIHVKTGFLNLVGYFLAPYLFLKHLNSLIRRDVLHVLPQLGNVVVLRWTGHRENKKNSLFICHSDLCGFDPFAQSLDMRKELVGIVMIIKLGAEELLIES